MQALEDENDNALNAARRKAEEAEKKWQAIQEAERRRKREEEDRRVRELEEKIDVEWMGRDDVDEREAGLFYKGLRKHSVSSPGFAVADEVILPPRSMSIANFQDRDPDHVKDEKLYGGVGGLTTSRSGSYSSIALPQSSISTSSAAASRISTGKFGMTARTASSASLMQKAQDDRQSLLSSQSRRSNYGGNYSGASGYSGAGMSGYSGAGMSGYSNAPSSASGYSVSGNYSDASGYSSASDASGYSKASKVSKATKTKNTSKTKSSKSKRSKSSDSGSHSSDGGSQASYSSNASKKSSKSKRSKSASKRSSASKSKKSKATKSRK